MQEVGEDMEKLKKVLNFGDLLNPVSVLGYVYTFDVTNICWLSIST